MPFFIDPLAPGSFRVAPSPGPRRGLLLLAFSWLAGAACTGAIQGADLDDPAATTPTGAGGQGPGPTSTRPGDVPARPGVITPGTTPPPAAGRCQAPIAARVWRLTPEQYANSVTDLWATSFDRSDLPRDQLSPKTGFTNAADTLYISGALAGTLFEQGAAIAQRAGADLPKTTPCLTGKVAPDGCVGTFIRDFGKRAFRRPLEEEEVGRYLGLYRRAEPDHEARGAAEAVVLAMVMSPNFNYRTELGRAPGTSREVELTGWEIASALSFGLADSPPDAALLAAAEQGKLAAPAERQRFANALAGGERARRKMARFMFWQMQLNKLESAKDSLGPGVFDALAGEVDHFVREVMASPDATLKTLFTANHSYVDATTAKIYGLSQRPTVRTRVELPSEQRFGIFTQPAWLSASTSPVQRGHLLRDMFLCAVVPPPPAIDPNLLINELPVTPKEATEAEKWAVFVKERPACAGCHGLFVPLGLAFDRYDETGRYRTKNGFDRPISTAGEIAGASGWSGKFANARDLVDQLVASPSGQRCFVERYATYVLGQELDGEGCGLGAVAERFRERGLGLRALVEVLGASDLFVTRATQ